MSKSKQTDELLKKEITTLQNEELALFHSYNRHATSEIKLSVLIKLQAVINKLEILNKLKRHE